MSENYTPNDPNLPPPDDGFFSSAGGPSSHDETRPLPPYAPSPEGPVAAAAQPRRSGALTAGILAGALIIGGAAGVGGAAAYDAMNNDTSSVTSTDTSGDVKASNTAATVPGSVESVASKVLPSVVKINVTGSSAQGSGSGIILSKDGQILTNNHVASVAGKTGTITVNFQDGSTAKATIVGTDPVTDLAVIKAEGVSDLTPAVIGKSSSLQVGAAVVAVGSPYGLNATVTSGIVSALNRPVSVDSTDEQTPQSQPGLPGFQFPGQGGEEQQPTAPKDLSTTYPAIQTDAAINPGNSGGPLVDMQGRVVGINSSIRTGGGSSATDSGGSIGLGFAIPIDEVLPIVNQLIKGETPTHARLGVTVSDVRGNTLDQGAQIQSVEGGSAGADAGLQKDDIVTKVDDQLVDGSESLVATIRGHRPGETVKLTILRDGKSQTLDAKLASDETEKTS